MILLAAGKASDTATSQLEDDLDALVASRGWQRTAHADLVKLMALYQVTSRFITNGSAETAKAHLNRGFPVINAANYTASGHIIVLKGYNETGFIVQDPWGNYTSSPRYSDTNGENLLYSYAAMETANGRGGGWWLHLVTY